MELLVPIAILQTWDSEFFILRNNLLVLLILYGWRASTTPWILTWYLDFFPAVSLSKIERAVCPAILHTADEDDMASCFSKWRKCKVDTNWLSRNLTLTFWIHFQAFSHSLILSSRDFFLMATLAKRLSRDRVPPMPWWKEYHKLLRWSSFPCSIHFQV